MTDSVSRSRVVASDRAEATAQAIVTVAERLFREMGYQKTTVADLARDLRMSPANIYRFFPSKSAINEAVCSRILTTLLERLWAIARGPGQPEDRLRRLFTAAQRETIALFFNEKRMHDMVAAALEEHWGVIEEFIQEFEKALRHIILDGQADGRFERTDPNRTARLVHKTMLGFVHPQVISECGMPDDLAAVAAEMADFVLRALKRQE